MVDNSRIINSLAAKGRDLNDIIRDNSMHTMLLSAYATSEGMSFLAHCIQSTLHEVLDVIEDCEIDPTKLPENDTERLESNRQRLAETATKFVDSIYNGRDRMPKSLKQMSRLLYNLLSESYVSRLLTSLPANTSTISAAPSSRPRKLSIKNTPNRLSMPPIDDSTNAVENMDSMSPNPARRASEAKYVDGTPQDSPIQPRPSWFKRSPSKRSLRKYINSSQDSMRPPQVRTSEELNLSGGYGSNGSFTTQEPNSSTPGTVGFLTRSEKTVGSFIFLRFFVPGFYYLF